MTPRRTNPPARSMQSGFALQMILMVIVLLGVLSAAIMMSSRTGVAIATLDALDATLTAQAHSIRQRISACTLSYPAGNNGGAAFKSYPAGAGLNIEALTCPGAPSAISSLWHGRDGRFAPRSPDGFTWIYTNDASGVRLILSGSANSAVYSRLIKKFSSGEAQMSGGNFILWIAKA